LIGQLRSKWIRDISLGPDYEAVSYLCGDQTEKVQILLNEKIVSVPIDAACALRGLRHQDRVRILWIDALCIDQGNHTERAHQVLQLAKVYACATRTLVWLGDEDETLTESFSACLEDLRQYVKSAPLSYQGGQQSNKHQTGR
jgi:hypothetical protein